MVTNEKPTRDRWNALGLGMLLAAGCAALLLVLLSGCGAATTISGPVAGTQPTATPNVNTVVWHTAIWIGGAKLLGGPTPPAAMSPTDGNTAYVCTGNGTKQNPGNEAVWATHNFAAPGAGSAAGATFTRLHDLPVSEQEASGCTIVVDATDPTTLVAMLPSAGPFGPTGPTEVSYASFDSGQSWHSLGQQPVLFDGPIATYQGKIYGMVAFSYPQDHMPNPDALRVSSDHMQTWQALPNTSGFDAFWLNPSNGGLLAHVLSSGQFVTSTDGGQNWQPFANPMAFNVTPAGYLATIAVQVPQAGQPWMVCGLTGPQAPSAGQPPNLSAVCTRDQGQTYTTLPALPDTPTGTTNPAGAMRLAGITPDGSVLAMLGLSVVPQPPGGVTGLGYKLWRLPLGATQWQSLGVPPQFNLSYAPGALIAWPENGVCMAATPDCGLDYVAAYP